MKVTQPVNANLSKSPPKTSNKMSYKRMNFFQPCETCKKIVECRKKLFIEFRLTLQETDGTMKSDRITVDQLCSSREDVAATVTHLPTINNNGDADGKLEQGIAINSEFVTRSFKPVLDKSDLVKSKEKIEELLHERRKQLYFFVSVSHLYSHIL